MNIVSLFDKQVRDNSNGQFLAYQTYSFTYGEVDQIATEIAIHLKAMVDVQMVALEYTKYSPLLYASMVAIWRTGKTLIPIESTWSSEKKNFVINKIKIDCIISNYIFNKEDSLHINIDFYDEKLYICKTKVNFSNLMLSGDIAYVLFTSGSTGTPKPVQITHLNLYAYIGGLRQALPAFVHERISNIFQPTFDPFFHDLLITWSTKSTLCPIENNDYFKIGDIVSKQEITVWFSVPSFIDLLFPLYKNCSEKMKSIQYSLFCGEILTYADVDKWHVLAPFSMIFNLYGPSESTIAVSIKKIDQVNINNTDIVSLGKIFGDTIFKIVGEDVEETRGELYLSGQQIFPGYLHSEPRQGLVCIDDVYWYPTGDIVTLDTNNDLVFCGRKDRQVKIFGNRIELQDIENQLRKHYQDNVFFVTPAIDPKLNRCVGINIYITKKEYDNEAIKMFKFSFPVVIKSVRYIKAPPKNQNGKVDYKLFEEAYALQLC